MRFVILLAVGLFIPALSQAESASNIVARLAPVMPCDMLQAAAKTNGISLDGFDTQSDIKTLSPGDSVTALITLFEKKNQRTQWIIHLDVVENTNAAPQKARKPMVVYSSTGSKFEFKSSSAAAMVVRTMGPFDVGSKHSKAKEKSDRVTANPDFLGLGLDEAVAVMYRLNPEMKNVSTNGQWGLSLQMGEPFEAKKIEHDKEFAQKHHITQEQERSIAGSAPALLSYFETVQHTPELEGILFKVIRMPSTWSIIKNFGVDPDVELKPEEITPLDLSSWQLMNPSAIYSMPWLITLNDQPALKLTLIVTSPKPPFLACGGIIGMLAENPADKENYLTMRIISAHYGKGATGTK